MGWIVALARPFLDRMSGLIAVPMAAVVGIDVLIYSILGVALAASTPARMDIQRRPTSTTVSHLAMNQAPFVHSTSLSKHAYLAAALLSGNGRKARIDPTISIDEG